MIQIPWEVLRIELIRLEAEIKLERARESLKTVNGFEVK